MKQFLKGGEAETYEGISIEWIRGAKPVLTIYEDGVKREDVQLADYNSRDALHALMKDKGFEKKPGAAGKVSTAIGGDKTTISQLSGKKGVERLALGAQGEVIEEGWEESEKVQEFGLVTGILMAGGLLYYLAANRKKNERSTV